MKNKIKKLNAALKEIIKQPSLLNLVLAENEIWKDKVDKKYHLSSGFPVLSFTDLFLDFEENLRLFSFTGGGSLPTDIALLKGLCKRFDNPSFFEIGTWRGETVYNLSEVAKTTYTLNLSKKEMLDLGMTEAYANAQAYFSKNLRNVVQLEGDSRTFDYRGLNQKFDVIFIDGNHNHDFVVSDTKKVFESLLHENSIVVWHDYAYNPESVRFEVMDAILEGTPQLFRNNLYHVSNTMCAIFIRGDFATKTLDKYADPENVFEIEIKSKKFIP